MAKNDDATSRKVDVETIIEHLEKSEVFERLVAKIRRIWDTSASPASNIIAPLDRQIEAPAEKIVDKDKIVEKRVEIPEERIVEKTVEVTPPWAKALEPQLSFLQQVQAHTEVASILLPSGKASLVQLIATAAQWSNVLRVWDALATQVKSSKQAVSVAEQQILEHSLALFNLTLQSNQASLQLPEGGAAYDYDVHQKVSGSGGSIEQVLLAGLYNAAGEKVRASIVTTR